MLISTVTCECIQNIDDCWAVSRDNTTNELVADPTAFPLGIKDVADYVHSKGLKFGICTLHRKREKRNERERETKEREWQ